jgi:hypothetical protein
MHRINVYIPASHLELVKTAMFNAGAGRIGNYDHCCWQIQGQGQFRPLAGSSAYIGNQDSIEYVDEFKIELVCESAVLSLVLAAMKHAHPYEEPAYDVYQPIEI